MFYIALGCFVVSVLWLAYVFFVMRPRAETWHSRQVLRKYRAQQLRNGYGRK